MRTEIENSEKIEIMYAIVDIAGQQFKVEKDQKLYVHRLDGEAGSKLSFDNVLLIDDGGKITIGSPVVKDASVSAKVIDHVKGDKVLVFKKKRRKGYRKLNGHRQYLTHIEITGIQEKAAPKTTAKASDPKQEEATTTAVKKPVAAKKTAVAKKPATTKNTTSSGKAAVEKKAPAAKSASAAKKPVAAKTSSTPKKPAAKKPATKKTDSGDKAADKK